MTFRARLASFLVASLVILQLLTALLVYEVTRSQIIREGERQLTFAGATFSRQLNDVSARVANDVQVLTLDFALRSAIAQRDRNTVVSALRNHGRRIGATRMLLIGLDGNIQADTQVDKQADPRSDAAAPSAFRSTTCSIRLSRVPLRRSSPGRTTPTGSSSCRCRRPR